MQLHSRFFYTLVGVIGYVLLGTVQADAQASRRLSIHEAEHLVAAWAAAHHTKGASWNRQSSLKERTPADLWERAEAQVFQQRGDPNGSEVDSYVIKDRKIYPLGRGFGGYGLTSLCVCDIDHDSKPELVYTYSWGSGIHRSHLGIMRLNPPAPIHPETEFVLMNTDLIVESQDDRTVKVYSALPVPGPRGPSDSVQLTRQTLLGQATLQHKGRRDVTSLQFEPGLAQQWSKEIMH